MRGGDVYIKDNSGKNAIDHANSLFGSDPETVKEVLAPSKKGFNPLKDTTPIHLQKRSHKD